MNDEPRSPIGKRGGESNGRLSSNLNGYLNQKQETLRSILREIPSALVAFSGGVDSTFLLHQARQNVSGKVVAATASSAVDPPGTVEEARELAARLGVKHVVVATGQLEDERFRANPPDRCYHCKKEILSRLWEMARQEGVESVLEGSNASDAEDYRPGERAVAELGVRSPLREAGLTKEEIRQLSREEGLPTWDKPAMACLATRFPYGTVLTRVALEQVAEAERYLRSLGVGQVRVRHHGSVARIEVGEGDMGLVWSAREDVLRKLRNLGYHYVALDLEGYRSGSMNRLS